MYYNISRDLLGIHPGDGVMYQSTSYGRREKTLPGVVGRFQKKCVDLEPGRPFTMAELEGPGVVTRIWVAVPCWSNPGALRKVALRAYFDGETEPSVLAPLGDFFGATFARPREYASAYLAITYGAYLCFFPMPFRRRAMFMVENQGSSKVRMFFYQITYLELREDLPEDTPYFHCQWRSERCSRKGPSYTVLEAEGRGYYLGCHLNMQGRGSRGGSTR